MTTAKSRINMRVSKDNLELIREAAEINGQDMTSFVLGASLDRARAVVLEARVTRLTAAESERLEEALAAEPQAIPALTALLRKTREYEQRTHGAASA